MDTLDEKFKKCSFCGEEIAQTKTRCDFCGSLLNRGYDLDISEKSQFTEPEYVSDSGENLFSRPIESNSLGNGLKVFLTVVFIIIPGFGQLAGIITAIVFMNNEYDNDRRSFGIALLVVSLVFFVLYCVTGFMILLNASMSLF